MRLSLRRRPTDHAHESACRICLDTGRVPYVDNHFDLWMVPCTACHP